uniref:Transmembrane protein n=1 Tax=Ascaris lumbricoides TaxID=6252 RepID=A0A0M3I0U3_ASCLU
MKRDESSCSSEQKSRRNRQLNGAVTIDDPLLNPLERRKEVREYERGGQECFDCCCSLIAPLVIVIAMATVIIVLAFLA